MKKTMKSRVPQKIYFFIENSVFSIEIEKEVISINQMMQDVAKMVVDQGEQLDNIEIEINKTHKDVKEAEKEMIDVTFSLTFSLLIIYFHC